MMQIVAFYFMNYYLKLQSLKFNNFYNVIFVTCVGMYSVELNESKVIVFFSDNFFDIIDEDVVSHQSQNFNLCAFMNNTRGRDSMHKPNG